MLGTKKGVLLDLDGVLLQLVDHFGEYGVSARTSEEIEIVDGLGELFDALVGKEFVIIGHTNQPDIARKKITQKFLDKKHALLQKKYPQVERIYVCSHTETDLCDCRKPKPGLLRQAAKDFGLDFSLSWVVGDSRGAIEAGRMVHAKTIFILTEYNCANPAIDKCTAVAKNVRGALSLILALENKTSNVHDV